MSDKHRCLMIGAGGMAGAWIRTFLPSFADRLEVVALVDVNPEPLAASGDFLGLPADRRFADYRRALDAVSADLAIIVIPPQFHTAVANACMEAGLDVLCEKPIADTWESCLEMLACQRRTGRKVQIIQNYRYTQRIMTLKGVITSGRVGRLNYLVGRYAPDYRVKGAWGLWRHEMPAHALLIEGSVHHLDQMRNLSSGDCLLLAGFDWNMPWTSFASQSTGLYVMAMSSGVHALYEGNNNEAGWQNNWHREYYRAECEAGAVVLDNDNQVRILEHTGGGRLTITEVEPVQPEFPDGHRMQVHQFLNWIDGGPEPETVLADNIKTAAMLFAAIEASDTRQMIDVAAKAAEADAV